ECQREWSCANKQSGGKESNPQQQKGKNKAPSPGSLQLQLQSQSTSGSNPSNKSKPRKNPTSISNSNSQLTSSSSNPLTNILGKNSKLTPQEHQRCKDRNLCMFCGGTSHTADNCLKKSAPKTDNSTKVKGRSAMAEQSASSSTTTGASGN